MDAMDTDDAPPASDSRPDEAPEQTSAASDGRSGANDDAWSLLRRARELIDRREPSLALQAIVQAMKSRGGEQAVLNTMQRARERYCNERRSLTDTDELASLFAECAIAEAQPVRPQTQSTFAARPSTLLDNSDSSLLALSGRKQIMLDAFADGSSFICLKCGGLVSNLRKDEHLAYWCSPTL